MIFSLLKVGVKVLNFERREVEKHLFFQLPWGSRLKVSFLIFGLSQELKTQFVGLFIICFTDKLIYLESDVTR